MTDRPDTQQDLAMTLATIEETLAQSADPQLAVEGIQTRLGDLFDDAEQRGDAVAQHAIQSTWQNVQQLAETARHHREAALTMKDIAETVTSQRDAALTELNELSEVVDSKDLNHPGVAAIYQDGAEEGYQDGYENAMNDQVMGDDDYAYDVAWEMMEDKYGEAFGYDDDAKSHKRIFIDIMSNDIEVQPNRKREFFAWLDAVKADNGTDGDDDE